LQRKTFIKKQMNAMIGLMQRASCDFTYWLFWISARLSSYPLSIDWSAVHEIFNGVNKEEK
jgi:hypothetical protein